MRIYRCLPKQIFNKLNYQLVPLRDEDKYDIMNWRNEQMIHLRQSELLSEQAQEKYFENVVDQLFKQIKPSQLLFSFLHENECIGYGGLVHIDWDSKNAEISFITQTQRTLDPILFQSDFGVFLELIFEVAYLHLSFFKLHTTFYDIAERKKYKEIIKSLGFVEEAKLMRHKLIMDILHDVFIYSHFKVNNK